MSWWRTILLHPRSREDNTIESVEQTHQRKEQSWQGAKEWVANEQPSTLNTSVKEFTEIDGNTTSYSMKGTKANGRLRVGEDIDLVLEKLKPKLLNQLNDKLLLTTDRRYKHYKSNKNRIILKDRLLFRKYYRKNGTAIYYQFHIPKQLVDGVLRNLPGDFSRYCGSTQTKIAYRRKYY